jgi:23S rRNA pseudouridine1911/1915/1917 synthase
MENEKLKVLYRDDDLLVYEKPPGINADDFPLRIHRLDKDTSGIFLVARNDKALKFFQKEFKERRVQKKYLALVQGNLKNQEGTIETLIGRSPKDKRKQKIYLPGEPGADKKRRAVTGYRVLEKFENFTLIEAYPETGRKHQIRAQLAHLGHPIAGDKLYGFRNQILPKGLLRHFLHASFLKIKMPDGKIKEFRSELPEELKSVIKNLNVYEQ